MKTKEEIVQLVNTFWFKYRYDNGYKLTGSLTHMGEKDMLVKLYTQCQEDMADYIFEIARQFHRLGKYSGHTSDTHFTDIYEETINSLNKQD